MSYFSTRNAAKLQKKQRANQVCGNRLEPMARINESYGAEFRVWVTPASTPNPHESLNPPRPLLPSVSQETHSDPIWGTLKTFCDTTTGHGFARLTRPNESVKSRVLWALLLFFLIAVLVASISNITFSTFRDRNVYHDQVLKTNDSMMFPDIHICDASIFNHSRLQAFGINDTMATYLALSLSASLTAQSIRADKRQQRELNEELRKLIAPHESLQNVLNQVTLQCQDIIAGCVRFTINLNSSECCNTYFGNQVHLNEFGACVTTHNQPDIVEYLPSQSTGLILYVKTNLDRVEFDPTIIAPSTGMKTGVVFAIDDSFTHTYPALSYKGLNVAPGYWATIPISLHIVDNQDLCGALLAPYSCIDQHGGSAVSLVPGFNMYSKLNCKIGTVQRFVEKELNCSVLSIPTNNTLEPCYPAQIIDFFSPEKLHLIRNYQRDNCIIDCEEYDYIAKISTAKISLAKQHYQQGWDENSLVALHFYFPSFTYTFTKNHPESLLKWLADVGGNMGLYMGASFVTIVEIVIFCFRCLMRVTEAWWNKMAPKNRAVSGTLIDVAANKQ